MIVRSHGEMLVLITQNDHARLARQMLSLWRSIADHPCREALLAATLRHDNGWRETDAAPPLDPSGRPHDFLSLPEALRLEIWDRGTRRYLVEDPESALLIAEHALHLLREPHREQDRPFAKDGRTGEADPRSARGEPGARLGLLELLVERRLGLQQALGPRARALSESYLYLRVVDQLSLIACIGRPSHFEIEGPEGRVRGALRCGPNQDLVLGLDPFPWVGSTQLTVPARTVADRAYAGLEDLGGTLARAGWRGLRLKLQPIATGNN